MKKQFRYLFFIIPILLLAAFVCYRYFYTEMRLDNFDKRAVKKDKVLDSIISRKNYVVGKKYKPLSLNYKGAPLEIIGKTTDALDGIGFSFRGDPNLEFRDYYGTISDFLSMDDNLQIWLKDGRSINGIVYFSSITKNKQIFTFSGNWTINSEVNERTKQVIADRITNKLFPKLKDILQIEDGWNYKIDSPDFIETFTIDSPEKNESHHWNLKYRVNLK